MSRRIHCITAVLLAALCECSRIETKDAGGRIPAGPGEGILFVGNSLTSSNDLPGLVEGLATAVGRPLRAAMVAFGGYSLEDHLNQGDALRSIATGGWRVVVLQQGPSSLEDSRAILRRDAVSFDQRIRAAGARSALFSVWPESARRFAFPDVAESYRLAAADVGGVYLPATSAWLEAWKSDPSLPLYSADGFHPSEQGSYLAALVIAGILTGASPNDMPARVLRPDGTELSLPPAAATVLKSAAASAIASAMPSGDVLVFTRTAGFRHSSIPDGVAALRQLVAQTGHTMEATEDPRIFADAALARVKAVVFLSTSGTILDAAQRAALEKWVRAGGGFVGVHAAADTEYDWTFYRDLLGARFASHPAIQQATIRVVDHAHPATAALPDPWTRTDEWYDFDAPPTGVRILAELDESTYSGGRMGAHHPIIWSHSVGAGRAIYIAPGHTEESYTEPAFRSLLLGALKYAAGDP